MSGETIEELEATAERKRRELAECDCSGCTLQSLVADLAVLRVHVAELREAHRCERHDERAPPERVRGAEPDESWPVRVRKVLAETVEGQRLLKALRSCMFERVDGAVRETPCVNNYAFNGHELAELELAALSFWQSVRTREGAR